jgi:hypothetical protein
VTSREPSGRPRAAAYLRRTPADRAAGRSSAAEQREAIERLVAEREWELAAVFDDTDQWRGSAPAMQSVFERLDEFDKLVVIRFEHLARGARPLERILVRLEEGGVDAVSVEEQVDTGTEAGEAARRMLGLLAAWQPRVVKSDAQPKGLRPHGFAPATVIDVGAGHGTDWLLDAFPDAYHVLIEPQEEFRPELERVLTRVRGERVEAAIGNSEGT